MVELSWLTISAMIIWVAATAWYITKSVMQKKIKKLEGMNEDLKTTISSMDADSIERREILEVAMDQWRHFLRESHNLRDLLRIQEGKTKSAEEAAKKLEEKIKFWKLEHLKDKAIVADMVQKLQAKDRENIRLSEFILKLNSKIKHYRLKMKKLYSEPVNVENTETVEIWTTYEEVIQLFEKNKAPNTAISEASTINRGVLRLQA